MFQDNPLFADNFLSAEEEINRRSDQGADDLAFTDSEFLLRKELRPVRFQLELLKPELVQQEYDINATVVVFGSARIPSREEASELLAKEGTHVNSVDKEQVRRHHRARQAARMSRFYEEARQFTHFIAAHNQRNPEQSLTIVTGGGTGIMEAANRGASECGEQSMGLNINLHHNENSNPYISRSLNFNFHYFALRKMHFLMRARALVAFPGGFGTLDEIFEALTLIQTGKMRKVPVLLYSSEFWQEAINFSKFLDNGCIDEDDLALIKFVDSPDQAWQAIEDFYQFSEVQCDAL